MHVTKDEAIKKIEVAMRREIADREADILNLIRVIERLINFLPCSMVQGDDWAYVWEEYSDTSQEKVSEVAATAACEIAEVKDKYCFD